MKSAGPLLALIILLAGWTDPATAQGRRSEGQTTSLPSANDALLLSAPTWDVNHDGVLTCDEWKRHATRLFRMADRNNDGSVNAEEFNSIRQADRLFASADLAYFDVNGDGRLSSAEFVDKPSPFFARFDKNGDCKVTPAEMTATRAPAERPAGRKKDRAGARGGGG
jgi:hypothetical protein